MIIRQAETEIIDPQNNIIKLVLDPISDDKLPTVSVVTITRNRHEFFDLMIRNYEAIDYPLDKIEWIIVDDSDNDKTKILFDKYLLNKGSKEIKYYKLDMKLPIGKKRNFINCLTKNEFIVHYDDDDIYPPLSIITRVRVSLKYNKSCVGCNVVKCYDLINNYSFEAKDLVLTVSESTFGYFKNFWSLNKYNNNDNITECINFLSNNEVICIDSNFVIIQLSHNKNTVKRTRILNKYYSNIEFDDHLRAILDDLKVKLIFDDPEYSKVLDYLKDLMSCKICFDDLPKKMKENQIILTYKYMNLLSPCKKISNSKRINYYCGPHNFFRYNNKWSPLTKFGGSEESVIKLSEQFAKNNYNVTVYCMLDGSPRYFNNVFYDNYYNWYPKNECDVTILWRDPSLLDIEINSCDIFFDMHDYIKLSKSNFVDNVRYMFKSDFHKKSCGNISKKEYVIPNGINLDKNSDSEKREVALCTCSPDRSLTALIRAIPRLKAMGISKLYWAYGFSSGVVKGGIEKDDRPEVMSWYSEKMSLLDSNKDFIVNLGFLSQKDIIKYYKMSKYFIYGTRFPEIDCISLTKACYYECIPIVLGSGALYEKLMSTGLYDDIVFVDVLEFGLDYSDLSEELMDKWLSQLDKDVDVLELSNYFKEHYCIENIANRWMQLMS